MSLAHLPVRKPVFSERSAAPTRGRAGGKLPCPLVDRSAYLEIDKKEDERLGEHPDAASFSMAGATDTGDTAQTSGSATAPTQQAVDSVRSSAGVRLDTDVRSEMERRFAHDFAAIRIHADDSGARAARLVGADAVALGQDLAFREGWFAPDTPAGERLLVHELAHSVQQRTGIRKGVIPLSQPGDRFEREANHAADTVMEGRAPTMLTRAPIMLARGTGEGGKPSLPRSSGLSESEWTKIRKAREFFKLPARPTSSQPTIVGVIITENGEEIYVKSGEDGGPSGGTQRGSIPRGPKEGFTGGGSSQGNIATHVEGHTAAIMHQRGLQKATLLIEEAPCRICDSTQGWDAERGNWGDPARRRTSPGVSTVIPPGSKLTIVDPETTGHYLSDKPAPRMPLRPAPEEPSPKTGPKSANPVPDAMKPPGSASGMPERLSPNPQSGLPSLPKSAATPKLTPKAGTTRAAPKGPRVLRGAGNIAVQMSMLMGEVLLELVVMPKLRELESQLQVIIDELEGDRRKRLEKAIQDKFDLYESKHIGRIVKSCYLGQLRALEQAGKTAFVNVTVAVSFEDTSNRFQLFNETPPESFFDLEFYDVDLKNAMVSETAEAETVGPLVRCESCGAMGRDKSFMGNNPLWQQMVTFSFEAPKSTEISHEFEKDPEVSQCLSSIVCFIATACHGTPFAREVAILRCFRDQVLLPHRAGRAFVRTYYQCSPPVARWLSERPWARRIVRDLFVDPLAEWVQRRYQDAHGFACIPPREGEST